MSGKWKFISKKNVFNSEFVSVEDWEVQLPNGKKQTYAMTTHLDAVFVFGISDEGNVLVLKQFFMSSQAYEHTLVAGVIEDEDPTKAAERELMEETGCTAKEFVYLGKSLRAKWSTGDFHLFLAKGVKQVAPQELEESEDIEVEFMPLEKFKQLLSENKLEDVAAVACAYKALEKITDDG